MQAKTRNLRLEISIYKAIHLLNQYGIEDRFYFFKRVFESDVKYYVDSVVLVKSCWNIKICKVNCS